ncbi:ADP ribosylation factor interacting protein arfaptin [Dermatophagoides pteronyssinus]|uniref:ADP ribosylation factor interacting protein arfaptin n=1 Tax=Dermatophagoides pteronyssinus TaxID=6956 RepID=UPI003F66EAF3
MSSSNTSSSSGGGGGNIGGGNNNLSRAETTTETYHHSSLGPVNITSFDSMQEIAIHDSNSSSAIGQQQSIASVHRQNPHLHHHHHRPATLPLTPPLSGSSNDMMIQSSAIITANDLSYGPNRSTPMDALKEWSLSTYKCTKQLINEKLGKCSRTVDADLEIEIEKLRETQHKYENILKLSKDMSNQYQTIIATQNSMYEHLNELALRETKSPSATAIMNNNNDNGGDRTLINNLSQDFKQNAEMMKSIARNGDKLLMALGFFISNLTTLVYKTIEDTIVTIRAFEAARLEYDAERNCLNGLMMCSSSNVAGQSSTTTTPTSTNLNSEKLHQVRCRYERLKEDVAIKMKFLDENKAKVMHKQLVLFHNAFAAFASGNAAALDSTLKQFSIRPQPSSFLEK